MVNTIEIVASKIRNLEISPVELVETIIHSIKVLNETSKIYITICEESAIEEAKKAECDIAQGRYRGLLHGIPYCCKDLFKTAGIKTTGGSKVLADYIPEEDAFLVGRLKEQGAILIGKVNQHEFAYGITGENPHYGTVSNPYNTDRLAGGSSSGSAAAVALDQAFFSLGTDTGGSARVPASLCGVVGLKPSYGLLSLEGVIPYCWSLDHAGIFSRTVNDAKIVLEALTDQDYCNTINRMDLAGLRVGVPTAFFEEGLDSEIDDRMNDLKQVLTFEGAELVPVSMPDLKYSRTVSLVMQLVECLSYHSRYLEEKGSLYGEDLKSGMTAGQFILAEHYVRAKRMQKVYRQQFDSVLENVDCMLTPTTPCVASIKKASSVMLGSKEVPVGNALTMYTSFFCLTGNPAISIPCGKDSRGLPFGAQVVGKTGKDDDVLSVALGLERCIEKI